MKGSLRSNLTGLWVVNMDVILRKQGETDKVFSVSAGSGRGGTVNSAETPPPMYSIKPRN